MTSEDKINSLTQELELKQELQQEPQEEQHQKHHQETEETATLIKQCEEEIMEAKMESIETRLQRQVKEAKRGTQESHYRGRWSYYSKGKARSTTYMRTAGDTRKGSMQAPFYYSNSMHPNLMGT